jgi:hypothetical protein
MRNVVMSFAATVVALSMMATPLIGQSTPLQGTWKLNVAKSTYSPGPPPKSQTLKWEPMRQLKEHRLVRPDSLNGSMIGLTKTATR